MRWTLAMLGATLVAATFTGDAFAQRLHERSSIAPVAFEYDYYFASQPPATGEPAVSPSDTPLPPSPDEAGPAPVSEEGLEGAYDEADPCEEEEEEYEEEEEEECEEPEPCRLLPECYCGLNVYGWAEMGYTHNSRNPLNPPNGQGNFPTLFNYRHDGFQLNQLYTVIEKAPVTEDCYGCPRWGIGGRVDLLYGEDYLFTQAAGLETHQDFSPHWNSAVGTGFGGLGRYGLAMPQAYVEVANDKWSVKLGHFYTIIGYEVVTAPDNFFYSHAYTMLYAEPFTHTGMLAEYSPNDYVTYWGGVVNGWDKFDAVVDRSSFLGGVSLTSCDERRSLTFTIVTGDEDGSAPPIQGNRTMYSIVYNQQIGCNMEYVLQHDNGWQENGLAPGIDAEWYGLNQYLFYEINPCWKAGARFEWFNDDDGQRVVGMLPFDGHYYELSLGLNYTPNLNVAIRPEVRWDWFDARNPAVTGGPFDNRTGNAVDGEDSQFTFAIDAILHF